MINLVIRKLIILMIIIIILINDLMVIQNFDTLNIDFYLYYSNFYSGCANYFNVAKQ